MSVRVVSTAVYTGLLVVFAAPTLVVGTFLQGSNQPNSVTEYS